MVRFLLSFNSVAKYIAVSGLVLAGGLLFLNMPSGAVYAADECGIGENPDTHDCVIPDFDRGQSTRDPAISRCAGDDCGLIERYLNPIINFLAIIVGVIVTISIVVGGIQYSSSADDPQKVAKAKDRIINAVIALVAFLFLYTFLQWLVPGGFLN